jgi:hypothetical protein
MSDQVGKTRTLGALPEIPNCLMIGHRFSHLPLQLHQAPQGFVSPKSGAHRRIGQSLDGCRIMRLRDNGSFEFVVKREALSCDLHG